MNTASRTKVVTLTLCNEAHDFLKSLVYGHRGYGQALSQILLEEKERREQHHARQEATRELQLDPTSLLNR